MSVDFTNAEWRILNTKLDGIERLLTEKLTNIEEKVDHDRAVADEKFLAMERRLGKTEDRVSALEKLKTTIVAWGLGAGAVIGLGFTAAKLWLDHFR